MHGSLSGYKLIKIREWNFSYSLKSVYVKDREFYKDITMEIYNKYKYKYKYRSWKGHQWNICNAWQNCQWDWEKT